MGRYARFAVVVVFLVAFVLREPFLAASPSTLTGDLLFVSGSGSPEGVISGDIGRLYLRTNGAAGTCLYVKESGTGNTGWVAVTTGGGAGGPPTGSILPYGTLAAPSGYLLCDGAAVSRTTYSALFTVVGTTFGAGDGSTTFNVPDLRGRTPIGHELTTDHDIGETGGAATINIAHTHGVGTLVNAAESTHTHGVGTLVNAAEATHTHGVGTYAAANESAHTHVVTATGTIAWPAGVPTAANESAHTHSVTAAGTNAAGTFTIVGTKMSTSASGTASATSFNGTVIASGNTTVSVPNQTFTGSAVTSGGGAAHTHTISWPAGVPAFSGTGATSDVGSAHTHVLSGSSAAGASHNHAISGSTAAGASHNHAISGATDSQLSTTQENRGPYQAVQWVIKT